MKSPVPATEQQASLPRLLEGYGWNWSHVADRVESGPLALAPPYRPPGVGLYHQQVVDIRALN